jgi:N-glycosylase/DNA lyase
MTQTRYRDIETLRLEFEEKKHIIRDRLDAFRRIPREEHFYELAYCLLTPQSSAVHAGAAVEALRKARCFDRPARSAEILRRNTHYVRFHNTKAARLADAWEHFPAVAERLATGASGNDQRTWLVQNVGGFGWKEASHFLRNIGYRDLAILDRHILRNLTNHGVLATLPKTLTPRRYRSIENRFRRFARAVGITMDELDLLFWSRETGQILK